MTNGLPDLIRNHLNGRQGIEERQMFGGNAFMIRGNMFCGTVGQRLVVRLGHAGAAAALEEPHTSKMDFTGTVIKTMVYVDATQVDDAELRNWIDRGLVFCRNLPVKKK